ncbi:MAG TPA: hypothetical protein VIB49_02750 [Thermoplasmata archaeon]|jgi:hypothetical protein
MEAGHKGRFAIDVPTLLYVLYITWFIGLMAAAGFLFGFNQVTLAFAGFTVIIIVMIHFTARLISD